MIRLYNLRLERNSQATSYTRFPNDEVKVPGRSEMTGPQGHSQLSEFQT